MAQNFRDGVPNRFVLVPHSGHGVDLESPAEDVTREKMSIDESKEGIFGIRGKDAYNGYVHVCATAPETAPAQSFRTLDGFFSPSGVSHFRTDS